MCRHEGKWGMQVCELSSSKQSGGTIFRQVAAQLWCSNRQALKKIRTDTFMQKHPQQSGETTGHEAEQGKRHEMG